MMARTCWCWIDTSVLTSYSFGIDSFQRYHEYNYIQTVGGCITSRRFQYVDDCAKTAPTYLAGACHMTLETYETGDPSAQPSVAHFRIKCVMNMVVREWRVAR